MLQLLPGSDSFDPALAPAAVVMSRRRKVDLAIKAVLRRKIRASIPIAPGPNTNTARRHTWRQGAGSMTRLGVFLAHDWVVASFVVCAIIVFGVIACNEPSPGKVQTKPCVRAGRHPLSRGRRRLLSRHGRSPQTHGGPDQGTQYWILWVAEMTRCGYAHRHQRWNLDLLKTISSYPAWPPTMAIDLNILRGQRAVLHEATPPTRIASVSAGCP